MRLAKASRDKKAGLQLPAPTLSTLVHSMSLCVLYELQYPGTGSSCRLNSNRLYMYIYAVCSVLDQGNRYLLFMKTYIYPHLANASSHTGDYL